MIVTERVHLGSHYYKHTYSDAGFFILQKETGVEYDEAYDIMSAEFTYEETDHKIEVPEKDTTEDRKEAEGAE